MEEPLENLGMTRTEAQIFLELLELGETKAGQVVRKSGVQNAVVHRALQSLGTKGFVTTRYEGKTRIYQTIPPKQLLARMDEQRAELAEMLPVLEAKYKQTPTKGTLYKGIRGVKECLLALLDKPGDTYKAYGGPQAAHDSFGDFFWEHYHNKRRENKIRAQLVFDHKIKWWAKQLNSTTHTNVRLTHSGFEERTETIIYADTVVIVVYGEKPYAFEIEDPLVAKSYEFFFASVWKGAKKLTGHGRGQRT